MSLRIPFVLWTAVPEHEITAIQTSFDDCEVVTGTKSGMACKWSKNIKNVNDRVLRAQYLMIPSSCSPIISMCISLSHGKRLLTCGFTYFLLEKLFLFFFYSS